MVINHVCNENEWVKPQDIKGVKTLILGSFNPYNPNGNNTDYYYGRSSNYFWKVVASLLYKEKDYFTDNCKRKLEVMEHYKFCFLDVISSINITSPNNNDLIVNQFVNEHIFTDFTDSKLFTTKHKEAGVTVQRQYNAEIIDSIEELSIKKVIHTMGQNTINLNFKTKPLEKGLEINGLQGHINSIRETDVYFEPISFSPSQYAVHAGGPEYLQRLTNWMKENLEINN
jgi:hypothetical protein